MSKCSPLQLPGGPEGSHSECYEKELLGATEERDWGLGWV